MSRLRTADTRLGEPAGSKGRRSEIRSMALAAIVIACALLTMLLYFKLLVSPRRGPVSPIYYNPTEKYSIVGPNYPNGSLANPNPLHTFTAPRQRACTSGHTRYDGNFTLKVLVTTSAYSSPPRRGRDIDGSLDEAIYTRQLHSRNHLLQSLYRARYPARDTIIITDPEGSLSVTAIQEVQKMPKNALIVVMGKDATSLFTLPPEELVQRFKLTRKRLLLAGNRDCDFCYCHPTNKLPLWLLNISLQEMASDEFADLSKSTSTFADSNFFMGYKTEVLEYMRGAAAAEQDLCGDEKFALSFFSMRGLRRGVGIDYFSYVFGTVSLSEDSIHEKWLVSSPTDGRGPSALGYRHVPPRILQRERIPRFPYPPILLFTSILQEFRGCRCTDKSLELYNDIIKVAMGNALAPYLLTPFRDRLLGISAGRRLRFGGFERPRIVVSLTSIPGRIETVVDTIKSLLQQDMGLDTVYLHVPAAHSLRFGDSVTEIPQNILELARQDSRFIINRNCTDNGPATKLIPTLELEIDPNTLIITVDDDMIFKPNAVRRLVQHHLNSPDTAFANAGQIIDFATDGPVSTLGLSVRSADMWQDGLYPIDILEAFMGAIYRRDFFNLKQLRLIPVECQYTDDIWISANLALRGIPRIKLLLDKDSRPTFSKNDVINALRKSNAPQACGIDCVQKNEHALSETTIKPNRNDICAKHLLHTHFFKHSKRYWQDLRKSERGGRLGEFNNVQRSKAGLLAFNYSGVLVKSPRLHTVCPFEFTQLEPHYVDEFCSTARSDSDMQAEREWLISAFRQMDSGEDLFRLRRMRYIAAVAFRSPCFPGLVSAGKNMVASTSAAARMLKTILLPDKRKRNDVMLSTLLCESEFLGGSDALYSPGMKYFVSFNRVVEQVNICIYKNKAPLNESTLSTVTALASSYRRTLVSPPERCIPIDYSSRNHLKNKQILDHSQNYFAMKNWMLCLYSTSEEPKTTRCSSSRESAMYNAFCRYISHNDVTVSEIGCVRHSMPLGKERDSSGILTQQERCVRVTDVGALEFVSMRVNMSEANFGHYDAIGHTSSVKYRL